MGWQYYLHVREKKYQNEQYRIVALVQSTPQKEGLKTVYLAELLDLSTDRPINLYHFNAKEAETKLAASPLIKKATVKKILPGTLYVDYQMRTPVAFLGDFANTAIDEEGYLFPFKPFFTPKRLPTFYFGLEKSQLNWGCCLFDLPSVRLGFNLMRELVDLESHAFTIKQIDLSQVQADSYGQRQIVVVLESNSADWLNKEKGDKTIYLRLTSDHVKQELINFQTLYTFLNQGINDEKDPSTHQMVIDLRIPHLAFIKRGG